jgi:hypothetical protein
MKYGAFRQRWAAGLEVDEDPITGQKIQPFKLDIKSLWTTADPERSSASSPRRTSRRTCGPSSLPFRISQPSAGRLRTT